MNKESYSVPNGPTARYDFQRNAVTLSIANAAVWNIPDDILTAITPVRTRYELKYSVANNRNTQSPAATADRDAAWDEYEPMLVNLYNQHLINNDAIDAASKGALNINTRTNAGGAPTPAQTTTPIITLVSEEISVLHVVYSDSATPGTHYKPANVAFCEICYKVGEPAPATIADCTERYNVARSHEGMVFEPSQRGKIIYAHARWVNKNGKTGPWSNLVTALIP